MQFKNYREYIIFGLSTVFFVMIFVYGLMLYLNYKQPIEQNGVMVEVNLPVIDWQKYQSLSKHY